MVIIFSIFCLMFLMLFVHLFLQKAQKKSDKSEEILFYRIPFYKRIFILLASIILAVLSSIVLMFALGVLFQLLNRSYGYAN